MRDSSTDVHVQHNSLRARARARSSVIFTIFSFHKRLWTHSHIFLYVDRKQNKIEKEPTFVRSDAHLSFPCPPPGAGCWDPLDSQREWDLWMKIRVIFELIFYDRMAVVVCWWWRQHWWCLLLTVFFSLVRVFSLAGKQTNNKKKNNQSKSPSVERWMERGKKNAVEHAEEATKNASNVLVWPA